MNILLRTVDHPTKPARDVHGRPAIGRARPNTCVDWFDDLREFTAPSLTRPEPDALRTVTENRATSACPIRIFTRFFLAMNSSLLRRSSFALIGTLTSCAGYNF